MNAQQFPPLWTTEETAKYLNCSVIHLKNLRERRQGPPFVKWGTNVRYVPNRVIAWVATHEVKTTNPSTEK